MQNLTQQTGRTYFIQSLSLAILLFAGLASCTATGNSKNTEISNQPDTPNMKTIIVDVRTPEEWQFDGHAPCSVNYPLGPAFQAQIPNLRNYEKIVLVCRSGARAGSAKALLESQGIRQVENKGPWQNVQCN
jgi:phage shock protein E